MSRLNREITLAANKGSDALQGVIAASSHAFNAINVATALHRLSRLHASDNLAKGPLSDNAAFQALLLRTVSVLGQSARECDAKAVSTIAYSLAGVGVRDTEVAQAVVAASLVRLHDLDRQGVANLTWALSKLPKTDSKAKLARKLALRARDLIWDFLPQEICNVLWALSKLRVRDTKLMSLASEAVKGNLANFTPQGLATLSASFARAGVFVESLLDEVGAQAQARLTELNVRDAAQIVPKKKFTKALVTRATELVPTFGAHRSVRLLTALAKLAFSENIDLTDLTQSLVESLQLLHPRMGAQELGISAWALATLKPHGWKKLLGKLVARAADENVMPGLNWWSVAHLEYAIRVGFNESPTCKALAAAPDLLQMLTQRCTDELDQIQHASQLFQEAPLIAVATYQPWQHMPDMGTQTALVFGPGRHVRRALQRNGFEVVQWYRFAIGTKTAQAWPPVGVYHAAAMRYPDSYEAFDFALHAIAAALPVGAPAWVYGDVKEGVLSTTRAIKGLFRLSATHEDGDTRILCLQRLRGQAKADLDSWFKQDVINLCEGEGSRPWWSMPGLFAGGFVDVMSRFLLDTGKRIIHHETDPPVWAHSKHCKLIDFACGTGVLAAGMQGILPIKEMWLMDADAVALQAASRNLPGAHLVLADGFQGMQGAKTPPEPCHLIISNPPVHQGHADDLRVLVGLLQEAPNWLERGGELWLVTQEHIPTGRLFEMVQADSSERICQICTYATQDGRFVVWRARYDCSLTDSGCKRKHLEVDDTETTLLCQSAQRAKKIKRT